MLFCAADGYHGVEAYRSHLTQQFLNRAKQVKSNGAFETNLSLAPRLQYAITEIYS